MKKSFQEISRSMSLRTDRRKHSVSSILKDPSRSKLKHNRSVRFMDAESSSSSDSSIEPKPTCQQQSKVVLASQSITSTTSIPQPAPLKPPANLQTFGQSAPIPAPKFLKRDSYASQQTPTFIKKPEETKPKKPKKKVPEKSPTKTPKKNFHSSASPRIDQKVMNFGFRDSNFYAKLNKYISSKGSVSPERGEKPQEMVHKKSYALGMACNLFSPTK